MSFSLPSLYQSFSQHEKEVFDEFREKSAFFLGRKINSSDFWREFVSMFFLFHYNSGNEQTVFDRRNMDGGEADLYLPSLFSRYRGSFFLSGEKVCLTNETRKDLTWIKKRIPVLSFFNHSEDGISFIEPTVSLIVPFEGVKFFKKTCRKLRKKESGPLNRPYVLYVITILLLKREVYAPAKKYNPFSLEEFMKIYTHYEDIAPRFI